VALALDPALLHQRAFENVLDLHEAEQVNVAVRLIRATVPSANTSELRHSVSVLPQGVELSAWAASWLRKLDRPLGGTADPEQSRPDRARSFRPPGSFDAATKLSEGARPACGLRPRLLRYLDGIARCW
jgi:hypothetical protein